MMGFIVCVCYFFMTIVDISTSAKDGKLVKTITENFLIHNNVFKRLIYQDFKHHRKRLLKIYRRKFSKASAVDLEFLFLLLSKYFRGFFNDEVAEMSNSADVLRMKKTISVVVLMCHYILSQVSFLLKV